MHDWFSYLFYEATFWSSMPAMMFGFGLRLEGRERIPKRGPVLVVANHQSFFDPLLIGLACNRHLSYLARKTLFKHAAFAWIIRRLNAVPVDQEGIAKEGLKTVLHLLQAGEAVVVFPEGNRTGDGTLQPLMPGVHLLIKKSQATVVPVGIAGAFDALPRTRSWPLPAPLFFPAGKGSIAVTVGRPIPAARYRERSREEVLDDLTRELTAVHARAEQIRRKPR